MQVVLLNGPARSGKDALARILAEELGSCACPHFADDVKLAAHRLYGVDDGGDPAHFEDRKDVPLPEFDGLTPRQAYQWVSEGAKLAHGMTYWGEKLVRRVEAAARWGFRHAVVPDSGFDYEATPVVARYGLKRVLHVHLVRPSLGLDDHLPPAGWPASVNFEGPTFPGDTRCYWVAHDLEPLRVLNDGDLDHLRGRARLLARVIRARGEREP